MGKSILIKEYIEEATKFLKLTTALSTNEISSRLKEIITDRYTPENIFIMATDKHSNITEKKVDLLTLTERHCFDNVISPAGSCYTRADVKQAFTSKFLRGNTTNRTVFKKKMFKAEVAQDKIKRNMYFCLQTVRKIINNSFSGAQGAIFSFLYDKGNYNSITSIARSLIIHAFTTAENLLGDNFGLYDEPMLITHVLNCLENCNSEKVNKAVKKYNLKVPTDQEVFDRYLTMIKYYAPKEELKIIKTMLSKLTSEQLTYLFYYNSLKNIFMTNSTLFKKFIKHCFDTDTMKMDKNIKPTDISNVNEDISAIVSLSFNELLGKSQVYQLPTDNPENAKQFVNISKHMEQRLSKLDDLFDTFIYGKMLASDIDRKNDMAREIVPFSDTDSTTATLKGWVEWYTGTVIKSSKESYQISALCIYWLTTIIKHVLHKFSVAHGARGEFAEIMKMKNEFLYIVQIIYKAKKNYAGIISMQEGLMLAEMAVDIKGGVLRSSNICKASSDVIKDFLVNDILLKAVDNKISAIDLVTKVVTFENKIRASLTNGENTYLKRCSVRTEKEYPDPMRTAYFYYVAWQDIFAKKYGDINPPLKTSQVKLISPTSTYLEWLHKHDEKIYNNFIMFNNKYGKYPKYIILNPNNPAIPKEIIPLIDIKEIIYHNVKVLHMTLERFGIGIPYEKQKLLLSDIYTI